jgi:hypothetical protein
VIGPSDLYRVPLCTSPSQSEELLRYAHLEHEAADLAWVASTPAARTPRETGIRRWLASHLRLSRPPAGVTNPVPLRAGLAAVHFDDAGLGRGADDVAAELDHPCDLLAGSALILTLQPNQPQHDEACTCEH